MRNIFLFLLVFAVALSAQEEKLSTYLTNKLTESGEKVPAWVFFKDKGANTEALLASPESVVSKKSLKRRAKVKSADNLIDFSDLPVNENYVNQIKNTGAELRHRSRWFNAVTVNLTKDQADQIAALSFVKSVDVVNVYGKSKNDIEFKEAEPPAHRTLQPEGVHSYSYGDSYTQLEQINVPAVHDMGITGNGILVCVMDAGFNNLEHNDFSTMNILATWDFVNGDADVDDGSDMGTGSHGTNTLSTIGGFNDGFHLGPAFGADYILAKTENTESETPVEEDHWIAAAEWADSIGADVTSTSLGYITFDSPYTDYTWQDMDGNTCRITIGADIAAGKGIVVVNSAGNEGSNSSHNTLGAPSDGDSVLAVGAVNSTGSRVYFSSVGNTVDGRTKPDVMAMGSGVHAASTSGTTGYSYVDGTSFSCPLTAGVATLILSFNPNLTPVQVYDIMRSTADNAATPDREYGWGIINAVDAIMFATEPDDVAPDMISDLQITSETSNSFSVSFTAPNDTSVGGVMEYQIRYSDQAINDTNDFINAIAVEYDLPAEPGTLESFTVAGLDFATDYYVAVRSRDFWGNWSELSNIGTATTYAAPVLGVSDESFDVEANVGEVVSEMLTLSNTNDQLSTLDYSITLENNTFPEGVVKVNLTPVAKDASVRAAKGEDVSGNGQSFRGSGGPDTFGYEWIDSDDANGPQYNWNDISGSGSVATWTATSTFDPLDEGIAGPYDLGFTFKYYGQEFSEVYFSSNGFVSFESFTGSTFTNDEIPNSDVPNALIAAVWDDLDGEGGNVYYQQFDNRFVVQYDSWPEYFGSGNYTFQIIIYKNGNVEIVYNSSTGDLESATVGIENPDGTDGLQVAYNASYIADDKVVKFSAEPEWVIPDNYEGMITNGNNTDVNLEFVTSEIPQGIYSIDLVVSTNDPDNTTKVIPVTMNLGISGFETMNMTMAEGWNLVSVPLSAQDMAATSILHDATTDVFGFNEAYSTVDMLSTGAGYWVKYDSQMQLSVTGIVPDGPVSVSEGWNLIGPYNSTVQVMDITTVPAGIVESDFFMYQNSYQVFNFLTPGYGYWVKVSQAGEIIFSDANGASKANEVSYSDQITITDAAGKTSVLYFSEEELNAIMPPLPPAGSFDVRFDDNTYASKAGESKSVKLQGVTSPFTVTSLNSDYNLVVNGESVKLSKEEPVTIGKDASELSINSIMIPAEFALDQNFPNPFNPSTAIKFALPVDAKVTITLYNALGQKVSEIINANYAAGIQQINFNASELASGMYIYQISAIGVDGSNFVDTKKMMLMK